MIVSRYLLARDGRLCDALLSLDQVVLPNDKKAFQRGCSCACCSVGVSPHVIMDSMVFTVTRLERGVWCVGLPPIERPRAEPLDKPVPLWLHVRLPFHALSFLCHHTSSLHGRANSIERNIKHFRRHKVSVEHTGGTRMAELARPNRRTPMVNQCSPPLGAKCLLPGARDGHRSLV